MTPVLIGYFPKRRTPRPDWIEAPQVREVCSVSSCVAPAPEGWIGRWRHNGLWIYDTPELARSIVCDEEAIDFELFAYRALPMLYQAGVAQPLNLTSIAAEAPAQGAAVPAPLPAGFVSLGFDAVSRSVGTSFECSPLSCCNYAAAMGANEWCLFSTQEAAIDAARQFSKHQPEPGPYLVVEVLRASELAAWFSA